MGRVRIHWFIANFAYTPHYLLKAIACGIELQKAYNSNYSSHEKKETDIIQLI